MCQKIEGNCFGSIIVSFTSYPPRIGGVHKVVESLFKQSVQADEIILYLSLEEFPDAEECLPDTLRELIGKRGFRIEWVEGNLRSHKKYYYALQAYSDDTVITVDDDVIYAESMISDLVRECRRFPQAVAARRVRIVLKSGNGLESYQKWDGNLEEYAGIPRMDICAIGVGGICYPPGIVNERWFRKDVMSSVAGKQDDLWLKYNEVMDNVPVVHVRPSQKDIPFDSTEDDCLSISNVLYGGNDRCASALLERMIAENKDCYERWFQCLMNWDQYAEKKKEYCRRLLQKDMDRARGMPVYCYGAGICAEYLLDQLSALQLTGAITSIIVSDRTGNPAELNGIMVRQLDEIDREKPFGVIFGVSESNRRLIETTALKEYAYCPIELNDWALTEYFNMISG